MPNIKDTTEKNPVKGHETIQCQKCGKIKKTKEFYLSNSPNMDRYPMCKPCIINIVDLNNIQTVYNILKDMNTAFIKELWESALDRNPEKPFGIYLQQINSLPQYKNSIWTNSKFDEETDDDEFDIDVDFIITNEMKLRWGKQDNKYDYYQLEKFYWDMKAANRIESPQAENYLTKITKTSLNWDKAIAAGDPTNEKRLGDLYSKLMADSEFRAMDKTDADKTGGLRTFSQIYAEVEKDDFIPPWKDNFDKKFKVKQDIVDKTIMYILNTYFKFKNVNTMTEPPEDTPKIETGD